jgi:hypothetical protein
LCDRDELRVCRYFLWKLFSWELELIICFLLLVYFAVSIRIAIKAKHATESHKLSIGGKFVGHNPEDTRIGSSSGDDCADDGEDRGENPVVLGNSSSSSSMATNSDLTTGSGMDVLKIRMLADTVGQGGNGIRPSLPHAKSAGSTTGTATTPVAVPLPSPVSVQPTLTNKFDHTCSQKMVVAASATNNNASTANNSASSNSNNSGTNSRSRTRTGSNMSSGNLPKQSSSRKTANMISGTLYLYPMIVAVTWGPFLVYSLVFEYGELMSNYEGKSLYNNLLFIYLSGLAVQSGSFLTVVFFLKSKYARDEWIKLGRRLVLKYCSWCECCCTLSASRKNSYNHRKYREVSVMSSSVMDDRDHMDGQYNHVNYGPGGQSQSPSMDDCDVMSQRSSRVTSNSSVSGAVGTLHHGHHSHSHGDAAAGSSNHGNSRRGSKRSEPRYSILSNNVTHPIHADASVEERLLDNNRNDGIRDVEGLHSDEQLYYDEKEASDDNERTSSDDDDTLVLGRRTESLSVSFSEALLSSFR